MTGRLVDDVWSRRIADIGQFTHVAGDRQQAISLTLEKSSRWYETANRHRAPTKAAQLAVHFRYTRDALDRYAGFRQAIDVDAVCMTREERLAHAHDKSPAGLIDRGIPIVMLLGQVDGEMRGNGFGRRRQRTRVHHGAPFAIESFMLATAIHGQVHRDDGACNTDMLHTSTVGATGATAAVGNSDQSKNCSNSSSRCW